jgi:hypothetical protein
MRLIKFSQNPDNFFFFKYLFFETVYVDELKIPLTFQRLLETKQNELA